MKLSKVGNWFRSNIIRYFELDEYIKDNKNDNNSVINFINHFWNLQHSNESLSNIRGSYWNIHNRFRTSKGFIRFSENINRKNTSKYHTRYPFFIDERRRHYNILNERIYFPLSNIIIQDNEIETIETRLRLITNLDEEILSHEFIQHLENDNNNLFQEIQNLIQDINQHNFMVKQMMYTKDKIIKNKFIKKGIFPVYEQNYHSLGYYHFQDVSSALYLIWFGFLISRNIETEFGRHDFHTAQSVLQYNGYIIGRENDVNRLNTMQIIFEQIVRNRLILNSFVRLSENRQQLVNRINLVNNTMRNLSQTIQENRYTTECDCCRIQIPNQ